MKFSPVIIVFIGLFMVCGITYAGDFDQRRIAECLEDNDDASVTIDVVKKYCNCMSSKMGRNEIQSIAQWEKTHPVERVECDRESGWK
jgi:hypothetical protein